MSLQLKVKIPLETVALIRSTPGISRSMDRFAETSDSGQAVADAARSLVHAIDHLSFDFIPKKDSVDDEANDYPAPPCYPPPRCTPPLAESIADEEPEEVLGDEDEDDNDKQIVVTIRDVMKREERIEIWDSDTFDDLAYAYADRAGIPVDKFYFKFDDEFFETGMDDMLKKHGVTDGSVIKVLSVIPKAASPPPLPPLGLMPFHSTGTSNSTPPMPNNYTVPQPEFNDFDGKINVTVRNLMNQVENFTISHDVSLFEFAERYGDRTGLDPDTLRFKFSGGGVFSTKGDGVATLNELGLLHGGTVVAMPENVYY